ncbi:WxcM-like domain-containing protein [Lichenibacterium minor]|uniref:WxcM-like domain-containing protein n=1 Tax=Lichenibacterium minor TaxID=2316528 RepID=A0A4Q2U0R7_9HYPH|nr:FdtA/QdtA family cupin domain-containing protein [Lichenibacterium minor]RYC30019.1 WxcM-like domain-containing protein [Lichenibacterium minor]
MGKWRTIELPQIHDVRGNLTFVEGNRHVPFDIQRVYYLYDVPGGAERAGHAHKRLQQVIIAMSGSFDLHLDDGTRQETITLRRAHIGVLLGSMVWRVIDNFSSGAVCLCLASLPYEESDYYRSYSDFHSNLRNRD